MVWLCPPLGQLNSPKHSLLECVSSMDIHNCHAFYRMKILLKHPDRFNDILKLGKSKEMEEGTLHLFINLCHLSIYLFFIIITAEKNSSILGCFLGY